MQTQDKLRAILRESQWTQDDLAHRLGVSPKTLSFWVTGRSTPYARHLTEIDKLYLAIVGREKISPDLLALTEEKALSTHLDLSELLTNQEMLATLTLHLTYHTNRIEGSTMTFNDVATVLDDEHAIIPDRSYREQAEARNHRAALLYLLSELQKQGSTFRWTTDLVRNIHLRLMNGIMESAGEYRTYGVRVLGSKAARSNPASVPGKLDALIAEMNLGGPNLIASLAKTHATFELIHPFGDGNGRTGRLLMFGQALQHGLVPPLVVRERKQAYNRYLERSHMRGELDPLRLFVAESILLADGLLK